MKHSQAPVLPTPISVFVPVAIVGGHERMLVSFLQRSIEIGAFSPKIYCGQNIRFLEWCQVAGLPVEDPKAFNLSSGGLFGRLRAFGQVIKLIKRLPQGRPLLLAPGSIQSATLYSLAAVFATKSVVMYVPMAFPSATMEFSMPRIRDAICRFISRKVALWITISDEQRDLCRTYWSVIKPVLVIPNSNEVNAHRPSVENVVRDKRVHIGFVGRFDVRQKGLDWLLGFFIRKPESTEGFRFTLKGAHGDIAYVEELVNSVNQTTRGFASIEGWGDPEKFYKNIDILILSSRFEGVPLVALEAIQSGVPVIATKQSGLSEFLPPNALFDFGSDRELADILAMLLQKDNLDTILNFELEAVKSYLSEDRRDASIIKCAAEISKISH